ncbi:hypothetical protein ACFLYV_00020 [Chloroflexota bacterium]
MIHNTREFTFDMPATISRARRVLIKPYVDFTNPARSTSMAMLDKIISAIRQISDTDVVLLGSTPDGTPIHPVYENLGYNFPRVISIDVKDCVLVEVDNPLPKPFILPTFWLPNVILSSDYLFSVTPLHYTEGLLTSSIMNLLSLLPVSKYSNGSGEGLGALYDQGIDKVLADLYFTLPFDMSIIESNYPMMLPENFSQFVSPAYGKIIIGDPFEADMNVCDYLGIKTEYLDLIQLAKAEMEED